VYKLGGITKNPYSRGVGGGSGRDYGRITAIYIVHGYDTQYSCIFQIFSSFFCNKEDGCKLTLNLEKKIGYKVKCLSNNVELSLSSFVCFISI